MLNGLVIVVLVLYCSLLLGTTALLLFMYFLSFGMNFKTQNTKNCWTSRYSCMSMLAQVCQVKICYILKICRMVNKLIISPAKCICKFSLNLDCHKFKLQWNPLFQAPWIVADFTIIQMIVHGPKCFPTLTCTNYPVIYRHLNFLCKFCFKNSHKISSCNLILHPYSSIIKKLDDENGLSYPHWKWDFGINTC